MKKVGFRVSADLLKVYMVIIMAISVLGNGLILHRVNIDAGIISLIQSLCVPVIAFLLVEYYLYTDSFRLSLLRLFIATLIAEIPFATYIADKQWSYYVHSPMWAILIAFVMIKLLNLAHQHLRNIIIRVWSYVLIVIIALFIVMLSGANFGVDGIIGTYIILATAILYLLYTKKIIKLVIVAVLSVLLGYFLAPLSLFIAYFYDETGSDRISKYVVYAAYPAMLLLSNLI